MKERRLLYAVIWPYVITLVSIIAVTVAGKLLHRTFDLVNIVLLYLIPVLVAAVRWGLGPSIFASFIGILVFDFFFIPPFLSFAVSDVRYLISFFVFIGVALVTGTLAARLKNEADRARDRERRTAALYELSRNMSVERELTPVLQLVVDTVGQTIEGSAALFIEGQQGADLTLAVSSTGHDFALTEKDNAIVRWVAERRQEAGHGTDTLDSLDYLFLPISTGDANLAVLAIYDPSGEPLSIEQKNDIEAITSLTALAITRARLAEEAEQTKWLAESERLHRTLLNAVSHDLRTPLSSITGAVTSLLDEGDLYDRQAKTTLLETIQEGAQRMNRFISNLLDMARLESGILRPNRDWCDMEEILGVVIKETRDLLTPDRLTVMVQPDLPLVQADFALIEQVLINLLENAVKYSPSDGDITITVTTVGQELMVAVEDSALAIPIGDRERIFDKFYRLRSSQHVAGTGLGLSICKGIIEIQGGKIRLEDGKTGGNRFVMVLPLAADQPESVPATREEHNGI